MRKYLRGAASTGFVMTCAQMREWTGFELDELADQRGFVVAYPDGYKGNWNDCRRAAKCRHGWALRATWLRDGSPYVDHYVVKNGGHAVPQQTFRFPGRSAKRIMISMPPRRPSSSCWAHPPHQNATKRRAPR